MSKSNAFETAFLQKVFQNTEFSWNGVGNLYVSLHTADPGEAGAQNTSETTYLNYTRVAVSRDSSGWTVSANTVTNFANVTFPECGVGAPQTVTHFGVGSASSGAGNLFYSGALTTSLQISQSITPSFPASQLAISED